MTGAAMTRQVVPWIVGDPSIPTEHGAAFTAVNVAVMMPIDEFKRRVESLRLFVNGKESRIGAAPSSRRPATESEPTCDRGDEPTTRLPLRGQIH